MFRSPVVPVLRMVTASALIADADTQDEMSGYEHPASLRRVPWGRAPHTSGAPGAWGQARVHCGESVAPLAPLRALYYGSAAE